MSLEKILLKSLLTKIIYSESTDNFGLIYRKFKWELEAEKLVNGLVNSFILPHEEATWHRFTRQEVQTNCQTL